MQPGAVVAMVRRRDVADDVVVPERRIQALGRVVLGRNHVEGVEIIGDMALELRAATGREDKTVLGPCDSAKGTAHTAATTGEPDERGLGHWRYPDEGGADPPEAGRGVSVV